jgi:hypothetical protein
MRRSLPLFPFASLLPVLAFAIGAGCSAGDDKNGGSAGKDSGTGFDLDGAIDGAIDDDAACGKATYDGLRVPANLLVLFDRSASMQKDSKWDNATAAINGAFATADDKLGVGLLLFPAGKFKLSTTCTLNPAAAGCAAQWADGGCKDIDTTPNVLVDLLSKTRPQISSVLAGTGPNGDNTPTRWALKNAWAYMQKLTVPGDRYVVLVTDGLPTTHQAKTSAGGITIPESNIECADETTMEAETSAASAGSPAVKTFVIGVPGTETGTTFLSSIALNGKTAKPGCTVSKGDCHYQIGSTSFQKDLQDVLTDIAGKVASCIFQVPIGTDVQPGYINVSVDTGAGLQPIDQDPAHTNGWDYTDATQSHVEIYGPVCDAIKAQKVSNVKILAGCKTRVR